MQNVGMAAFGRAGSGRAGLRTSAAAAGASSKEEPEKPAVSPTVEAENECDLGEKFLGLHRNDDAIEAFKKALPEDPEGCATRGLEAAGPTALTRLGDDLVGSLPTLLILAVAILLVGLVVLALCRIPLWKRALSSLWEIGPAVNHILRPRLSFADFDDEAVDGHPGAPLTARAKERLGRIRDEAVSKDSPEYDLDFGTPREEFADQVSENKALKTALDSAAEVSDQTKLVVAVTNMLVALLPVRRFAVAGSLEPPAASGAALTLSVEEEGRSEAATRLIGPSMHEPPKAPDYMVLADPAAVWIQYEIACSLAGSTGTPTEAESQALVREGLDYHHREDLKGARECFEKALSLDHTNWSAYVGLAVTEARSGGDYARSVRRILDGLRAMKEEADG